MSRRTILAAAALLAAGWLVAAIADEPKPVPVTVENFIRAESDMYFSVIAVKEGRFGKIGHHREMMPVEKQTISRTRTR
jgi:hypothetical protein